MTTELRCSNVNKRNTVKAEASILQNKVEDLITKHNELVKVVMDLSSAIELINDAVFSQGDTPQKLDS